VNLDLFKWCLHPYVESVFGGTFHPGGLTLTETVAARLGITAAERILDVGCGTGATAVRLAQRVGCRAEGIDLLAELIPAAQARAEREGVAGPVAFTAGAAEALPWNDSAFHVVLMESVFVFLDDPSRALHQASRVLGASGRIAIIDVAVGPGDASPERKRLLQAIGVKVHAVTEADYRRALAEAGFVHLEWTDEGRQLVKYLRDLRAKLALAKMVRPSLPPELRALDLEAIQGVLDSGIHLAEQGEVTLATMLARKGKRA
jgi:SAM-dependent methyltransferase